MKKLFVLMLAMMLMLTGNALASGLGGLGGLGGGATGGGLDGLIGEGSGLLPDPCLAREQSSYWCGTLLQKDYKFSADYLCDAYVYPRQSRSFEDRYANVLRKFGYTMAETTVDGSAGYSIQRGDGKKALLVPDFDGKMLFLVEKGMDFVLMDKCSVVYNGAEYSMPLYFTGTPESYPHDSWQMTFKMENGYFERLELDVPRDVRAGSYYDIMDGGDAYDGLKMNYYRNYNFKELLYDSVILYRTDGIEGSRDYFSISITRVEDTEYGKLIVGRFDGRFYNGDDEFENGEFAAVIPN